jgi:uncharacterized protein YjiS (DUF1127 family)
MSFDDARALVSAPFRALWAQGRELQRAWRSAHTRVQLHALSDRTLSDIGLTRGDIDRLVR